MMSLALPRSATSIACKHGDLIMIKLPTIVPEGTMTLEVPMFVNIHTRQKAVSDKGKRLWTEYCFAGWTMRCRPRPAVPDLWRKGERAQASRRLCALLLRNMRLVEEGTEESIAKAKRLAAEFRDLGG